jgi:DivIVA domain-containing protein
LRAVAADQHQPDAPAGDEREPLKPDFTADELREHVPAEIRSPSFAVGVRGYDRTAVDEYVKRVNRVIAELEVSRSPQAAVRHALDRVGQQTIAVLQEARESADRLMGAAREEAEEGRSRAKEEAAKLVVNASAEADRTKAESEQLLTSTREKASQILERARLESAQKLKETEAQITAMREEAEARMREIQADTDRVLVHRHELLDDVHSMAGRLQQLASEAAARLNVPEQSGQAAEQPEEGQSEMVTLHDGDQPAAATKKPPAS